MPNTFAYVMLFAWPAMVYLTCRGQPLRVGILIAFLGALLLLPEQVSFDLPMLPTWNKDMSGCMAALLLILGARTTPRPGVPSALEVAAARPGWLPQSKIFSVLIVALFVGMIASSFDNTAPIIYESGQQRGFPLYAAVSAALEDVFILLIPLIVGRKFLGDKEGQELLLWTLLIAGLLYSILALWEIRMAPQLHKNIYGFAQHGFRQHVRGGAFRPLIFLPHGLVVSLFMAISFLSALALARVRSSQFMPYLVAAGYLFVVLVLTRSLGALALAALIAPLMLFGTPRLQVLFAGLIALLILSYPVVRGNNQFLIDSVMSVATEIDPERAASFETRVENEERLLDKAMQKPLLGWGQGGRARVRSEKGQDNTIVDGFWIITFGSGGWVRYISLFGLLCLPILGLALPRGRSNLDRTSAALTLLMAITLIDLIPNSGETHITWLIAGALIGRLEQRARQTESPGVAVGPVVDAEPPPGLFARKSRIPESGAATPSAVAPSASTHNPYAPVLRGPSGRNPHRTRS